MPAKEKGRVEVKGPGGEGTPAAPGPYPGHEQAGYARDIRGALEKNEGSELGLEMDQALWDSDSEPALQQEKWQTTMDFLGQQAKSVRCVREAFRLVARSCQGRGRRPRCLVLLRCGPEDPLQLGIRHRSGGGSLQWLKAAAARKDRRLSVTHPTQASSQQCGNPDCTTTATVETSGQ